MLFHRRIKSAIICILLALMASGCVTYPIKTRSLDENNNALDKDKIRTDLVYYLPQTMIKAEYTGGKTPTVQLTPVTVADRSAGFAIERPRRYGGRGHVKVATKASGESGQSTGVGLLSSASLASEEEKFEGKQIEALTKAIESLPEKFESKDNEKSNPQTDGGTLDFSVSDVGSLRNLAQATNTPPPPVKRESLCGGNKGNAFVNLNNSRAHDATTGTPASCIMNVAADNRVVTIYPLDKSWLNKGKSLDSCKNTFGTDRRNSSLCYRQKVSVPFAVCVETKESPGTTEVSYTASNICKGTQTIHFVEVYDLAQSYSIALNGQQFVAVQSNLKFDNGTLIAIDDKRPGVIKSAVEVPFAIGADIVNSLGLLVAAIFVTE